MSDFGTRLREARERSGVSLRDIAAHTNISVANLEAIERNDPSRLPGGIFARAFVRSYAAEVGLDPEATVREFVETFDVDPPLSVVELSQLDGAHPDGARRSRVGPTILKLVVVSLMAIAILFYFTLARNTEESSGLEQGDARRTSRRAASPVPKSGELP
jgi:cytoskeletal protein RodZ